MSSDIRSILERIVAIEEGKVTPVGVKHGLNQQQKSVPQLPALFKPKKISALGSKTDPEHPMKGMMVGASESKEPANALEEAMRSVEEDMLSKVKNSLTAYLDQINDKASGSDDGRREKETPELDRLTDKEKRDRDLIQKAVQAVERGETESVEEDTMDSELGHEISGQVQSDIVAPQQPISPTATFQMEDGTCLECYGDDDTGYELRFRGRAMPSKFDRLDHAKMAVDLFRAKRKAAAKNSDQDYIEER